MSAAHIFARCGARTQILALLAGLALSNLPVALAGSDSSTDEEDEHAGHDHAGHDHDDHSAEDEDSTAHLNLKIGLLFVIFFEALVGGLLPLAIVRSLPKMTGIISLMNAFSGGIFLTAGLVHILPHVVEVGEEHEYGGKYPLSYTLVVLGYILVFFVERVLFHTHSHSEMDHEGHGAHSHGHGHSHGGHGHSHGGHGHGDSAQGHKGSEEDPEAPKTFDDAVTVSEHKQHSSNNFYNAFVILFAISLHAVLAGVSLGVQHEFDSIIALTTAICSHKAPAAFSIGAKFIKYGLTRFESLVLIVLFACVTPLGICIGLAANQAGGLTLLILEGLSAGTFLYIGATEVSTDEFETCARACGEIRTGVKSGKGGSGKGTESGTGVALCDEPVIVHGAPSRVDRFWAFSAYCIGCFVIFMSALSTPEHSH